MPYHGLKAMHANKGYWPSTSMNHINTFARIFLGFFYRKLYFKILVASTTYCSSIVQELPTLILDPTNSQF